MIEKTTEEIPATTRTRERHVCDLCGKKTPLGDHQWEFPDGFGYSSAKAEVTVYSVVEKYGWENDGERTGDAWDFCPDCFREKVRPLLASLSEPRKVDESW